MRTLDRDRTALVVVDVQEAFRPAVEDFDRMVENTRRLMQGAKVLGLPVVVTEQYPKGLGRTVDELGDVEAVEKTCFSAARADGFDLSGRDQALVCGIEAHVCVNQTVLDLRDDGVDVHVALDAVGSRFPESKEVGVEKARRAGAVITNVETALFELVGAAGSDEFKQVQRLVK